MGTSECKDGGFKIIGNKPGQGSFGTGYRGPAGRDPGSGVESGKGIEAAGIPGGCRQ